MYVVQKVEGEDVQLNMVSGHAHTDAVVHRSATNKLGYTNFWDWFLFKLLLVDVDHVSFYKGKILNRLFSYL